MMKKMGVIIQQLQHVQSQEFRRGCRVRRRRRSGRRRLLDATTAEVESSSARLPTLKPFLHAVFREPNFSLYLSVSFLVTMYTSPPCFSMAFNTVHGSLFHHIPLVVTTISSVPAHLITIL